MTLARFMMAYCTHICNEIFAWFSSTQSNSRINFLNCLGQGGEYFYVLNAGICSGQ